MVLPEQPWLCCSPDGLVQLADETVLIEIKCTYKFKDAPFIRYEERHCELPHLIFIDYIIELRKSHQYYTELQVQMYVLNLEKALLFVYSQDQCVIAAVKRDEAFFWELIPKKEYFYFKFFVPALF